jgi:hypothetical protein
MPRVRPRRSVVAVLVAALVVLSPLVRESTNDTYPLSTYPMFAADRGRVHRIATAVEVEAGGDVRRLSPELIAGTDEVVLAGVTVARAVRRDEASELCGEIAARLGEGRTVEVRTETVDVVALVADGTPASVVETHATCTG